MPAAVRAALTAEAVSVCLGCPVSVQCGRHGVLMVAQEWMAGHVVLGGMTVPQLRDMARMLGRPSRKVARCGTRAGYVAGCRCPDCTRANAVQEAARRARKGKRRRECPALTSDGHACRQPAAPRSVFCVAHRLPDDDGATG